MVDVTVLWVWAKLKNFREFLFLGSKHQYYEIMILCSNSINKDFESKKGLTLRCLLKIDLAQFSCCQKIRLVIFLLPETKNLRRPICIENLSILICSNFYLQSGGKSRVWTFCTNWIEKNLPLRVPTRLTILGTILVIFWPPLELLIKCSV